MAIEFENIKSTGWQNQQEVPSGSNPLTNLAYGTASGAIGAGIEGVSNLLLAGKQQKMQKELMREQFRLNEKSQKELMRNMRESFESAGLNPALLHEGGYSAPQVSGASAPSPSVSAPSMPVNAVSDNAILSGMLSEQAADVGVKNAQKELLDRQAEGVELDNRNKEAANHSVDISIRPLIEDMIKQAREGGHTLIADRLEADLNDGNFEYNQGTIDGLLKFNEYAVSTSERDRKGLSDDVENEVNKRILKSPLILAARSSMDYAKFKEIEARISEYSASVAEKLTQANLNNALIAKLGADTIKLYEDIETDLLNNKHKLWNRGRYGDFFKATIGDVWQVVQDMVPMLVGGGIAAKGAKMLTKQGAMLRKSIESQTKATQQLFKNAPKYSEGAFKQISPEKLSGYPLSRRREMAKLELQSWHRSHPRVQLNSKTFNKMKEEIGAKYGIFKNALSKLR